MCPGIVPMITMRSARKTASSIRWVIITMLLRLDGGRKPARRTVAADPQVVDLAAQALGREDVERAERLVHAQQLGRTGHGPRDADALLHAAGQLLGKGVLVAAQADRVDAPLDPLVCLARPARRGRPAPFRRSAAP